MHSKTTELPVTVKIQNLGSKKEEKVKIKIPTSKHIEVRGVIVEKLISKEKWDAQTDSISLLYIRNEKKNEKYKVCSTYIPVQKGDKFLLKRRRIGEPVKRKKIRSSYSSSANSSLDWNPLSYATAYFETCDSASFSACNAD